MTKDEFILFERNTILLNENKRLKKENAELENENRLLGERCNQLLKDKGDLTDKIDDLKANFDYVLEGKEVEYKEERKKLCDEFENMKAGLESQIVELKDHLAEEVELHLHAEEYIKSLEQQIEKMKRHCNCKHRDSEGYCEVKRTYLMDISYDGCDKWELED